MARIRSIKPEFWTSEVVASWDVDARLTFIGLWSYADDNGVAVANDRLIASTIYPMDDPVEALERVQKSLTQISACGQIVLYECNGKRLLYITGWDEHQPVSHARADRYPRPPTCIDSNPPERLRSASGAPPETFRKISVLNREQGTGNRDIASAPSLARFSEFYETYPRRVDRRSAEKAWRAAMKRNVDPDLVISAAKVYAQQQNGKDPKYTKYPATWLNAGAYENAPDVAWDGIRRDPNTGRAVEW